MNLAKSLKKKKSTLDTQKLNRPQVLRRHDNNFFQMLTEYKKLKNKTDSFSTMRFNMVSSGPRVLFLSMISISVSTVPVAPSRQKVSYCQRHFQ